MRKQPTCKLPIASYPTVSPTSFYGITGRMLFNEIDIGHQSATRIAALQQIVTENKILGKTPIDSLTKGIYIVNTLTDE